MDRRTFLVIATYSILPAPSAVTAQKQASVRRIGWLSLDEPLNPALMQSTWAFARDLGWVEGQNLIVEYRAASGNSALLQPFAEDLVRLKVEIIITLGTSATLAARHATSTIPIVFYSAGDPVAAGLVANLARPGGNVTGLSLLGDEMDVKRLTLLREVVPNAQRVGDLLNRTNPFYRVTYDQYKQAYQTLGLQPIFVEIAKASELEDAIAEVARQGGQALVVREDGLFSANRVEIMRAALRYRLPTFVGGKRFMHAGALVGFTPDDEEHDRRFAALIDKILRGANPSDLPVEQPTKFTLYINLKTAKALGLAIPQAVLARADEVIE